MPWAICISTTKSTTPVTPGENYASNEAVHQYNTRHKNMLQYTDVTLVSNCLMHKGPDFWNITLPTSVRDVTPVLCLLAH